MAKDVNKTYCGDHCSIYPSIRLVKCTSENNTTLYINYTSIFQECLFLTCTLASDLTLHSMMLVILENISDYFVCPTYDLEIVKAELLVNWLPSCYVSCWLKFGIWDLLSQPVS